MAAVNEWYKLNAAPTSDDLAGQTVHGHQLYPYGVEQDNGREDLRRYQRFVRGVQRLTIKGTNL